nr:hypothetical protein [Tanacetum cinerariifolium]
MLDDLKVLARCISIWKSHNANKPNEVWGLNMVFEDLQGNRVQATAKNQYINKFQLLIDKELTRVANFDNNTRGFKFESFSHFTTRTFGENEVVDVIGTIVSISYAIPFNNFRPDKIRRTLIIKDVKPDEIKRTMILEDVEYKVIIRVINDIGSASLLLFDDIDFKLSGVQCYTLIKQCGKDYDDYFPSELNGIVGKKLLFRFYYNDYNINNNNHVYQVQRRSQDEAMINVFKKDFISEDAVNDLQTSLSKNTISFRSGKRTIIDLEDYNKPNEEAKRGKKIVQAQNSIKLGSPEIESRVANFNNNTRGFEFEPFLNFTARTFGENEVVDVIGTIVSISDAIPFSNFGPDKIRRTLILEDVEYAEIDGYDPQNMTISLFSDVKKELTPKEHEAVTMELQGAQGITAMRIGYKVIIRVINDIGSASLLLFDDMVFKLSGVQCYTLIKQYGEDYDDYFPSELNGIVRKNLLFRFHYTDYNIHNNNHVYQVQRKSQDEAMINVFKKDIISEDAVVDLQTPLSKNDSFGSGKQTIIDLEEYNKPDEESKRGKEIVQVKVEPKE